VDLLVGCGGWSAPLLVASYFVRGGSAQDWAAIFYSLALVCNYPHYMATLHRAYARREDRSAHRLFTHGVTAVLLVAALAAHLRLELLTWLFTAYVMWSPWHYTGQNYGLLMMFLRRNGVEVTPGVRRALRASFVASYLMLLAAFNEGASADPLIQSLGLPVAVTTPIQVLAAGMFGAVGVAALAQLARSAGLRALAAPMTLYSTQALWFVVPIGVSWVAGVRHRRRATARAFSRSCTRRSISGSRGTSRDATRLAAARVRDGATAATGPSSSPVVSRCSCRFPGSPVTRLTSISPPAC
jgi:hypothetical protein